MKITKAIRAAMLALVAAAIPFAPRTASAQQHYWYDGTERRALWSVPGIGADFSARTSARDHVLRPSTLIEKSASQSPVFRDSPAGSGGERALPGGVIVRLHPDTSEQARQALFARHGVQPQRALGDNADLWLIASPPGLPALELANRLHESGDFGFASPNWWRPRALK
jgi:hypothetical protein